ncbi:hypothetical protein [Paenibacillus tianjinensis]|uniref:RiboL-PSP-HEPN domain-containing protein n=1 Tax=Paenibacillus tianjinensis TaxID=2810347 RepID=A0ABX7L522_9BACL|nr:hypothetical protein [Paenibacillus tianjinensis]QSF42651.1 hypothetical protein JRJ22_15140 [Paenibacillus tianjinensis]
MTTPEHIFMMNDARDILHRVQNSYQKLIRAEDIPRSLLNDVRNFLNNIESALDYIAFEVFNKYCLMTITDPAKIESAKRAVNFPLHKETEFTRKIDKVFPDLRTNNPDIIDVFEKCQPYNHPGEYWLPLFNKLVNNNKHRELEKQRISSTSTIHNMIDANGNTFTNVTFQGFSADMKIDGNEVNLRTFNNHPHIRFLDATVRVDFIFKSLNTPVLPALTSIYIGANSVVNEINMLLNK